MATRLFINVMFYIVSIWFLAVFVAALLIVLQHYVPIVFTDPRLREGLKIVVETVVLLVVAWLIYLVALWADAVSSYSDIRWYRSWHIGMRRSGVQMQGYMQGLEKARIQKLFGLPSLVPRFRSAS